jgi:tight adherence protein C
MSRQVRFTAFVAVPLWAAVGAAAYLVHGDAWVAALSGAIGLTITMLVVSIFAQPGTAKLSPQRAAAIAAGRADRRTVFEIPALRPVMWLLLSAGHSLAMPRLKRWLREKLIAAGSPNYYTAEEYLAVSLLTGLALAAALETVHVLWADRFSFSMLIIGFVVGAALAIYHVQAKAADRIRAISRRVPYALDLIALAMGAGATFTEAVRTIVHETDDDPLHLELRTMLAEMELGTTRRQALLNLAERVPLDSLRNIVASVVQAEELGTPLGDVLHDQATLLRLQRSVRAENRAAVASVRILVPCLLLLMAVILAVFGPAILRAVRKGLF